jgi:hypothetical protein
MTKTSWRIKKNNNNKTSDAATRYGEQNLKYRKVINNPRKKNLIKSSDAAAGSQEQKYRKVKLKVINNPRKNTEKLLI